MQSDSALAKAKRLLMKPLMVGGVAFLATQLLGVSGSEQVPVVGEISNTLGSALSIAGGSLVGDYLAEYVLPENTMVEGRLLQPALTGAASVAVSVLLTGTSDLDTRAGLLAFMMGAGSEFAGAYLYDTVKTKI